jgi:hypothetical protein
LGGAPPTTATFLLSRQAKSDPKAGDTEDIVGLSNDAALCIICNRGKIILENVFNLFYFNFYEA